MAKKINDYQKIFLTLVSPYMALTNKEIDDLAQAFDEIEKFISEEFYNHPDIYENKINQAKDKFVF